jgi:putative membrane protein
MKASKILKITTLLISLSLLAPISASANASSASILSTIVTIDGNEILAAVQTLNKNSSSNVTDFAKTMIEEHGKNLTEALALANKIHALPLNPNPDDLHTKGANELVKLSAAEGTQYDKDYADAMVKGHTAALHLIDMKLMKAADNADLKSFLTNTRAAVAHHLEEAKKLQAALQS